MEVVQDEPLRGGMEQVGEREPAATHSESRCRRPSRYTGTAPVATASACVTRRSAGSGQSHQSGANAATIGSKCAPSREICFPVRPVTDRKSPLAVDQTAWTRLPTSKRPVQNARCWSTASDERPAPNAAVPAATSRAGPVTLAPPPARAACATARRAPARRPCPRTSRDRRGREPLREPGVLGDPSHGARERPRIAGRDEQRVDAVRQELACRRRVRRDHRACARERLEDLVRDHAGGLLAGPEDPERAPGAAVRLGQLLVGDPGDVLDVRRAPVEQVAELALADHAEGDVGRERGGRRGSSRARAGGSASRRRGRGTARAGASRGGRAARRRPTSATATRSSGNPNARRKNAACASVSATTRSAPRNAPLSTARSDAGRGRARPEPAAVADERVVEGDERVEHDGTPARDPPGGGHVEVPRVADDDDVGVVLASPRERALRARHPRQLREADRPVVPSPHLPVTLHDRRRPRRRRHETTWVFRGDVRSYVPK